MPTATIPVIPAAWARGQGPLHRLDLTQMGVTVNHGINRQMFGEKRPSHVSLLPYISFYSGFIVLIQVPGKFLKQVHVPAPGHLHVFIRHGHPAVELGAHVVKDPGDRGDEPVAQAAETAPDEGQGEAGAGVVQQAGESAVGPRRLGLGRQAVGQGVDEGVKLPAQLWGNVRHSHSP